MKRKEYMILDIINYSYPAGMGSVNYRSARYINLPISQKKKKNYFLQKPNTNSK
jgi:hypothetical protein